MNTIAIIPCLNCHSTIGLVVQETQQYIPNILVIDDGSDDDSSDVARYYGANVVRLNQNFGVGQATQIGLSIAHRNGYDHIVTLDADGAHNPKDIPSLLDTHIKQGNLLTIGNRWYQGYTKNIPGAKWWANVFAAHLINRISNLNLPDVACGLRVISADLITVLGKTMDFGFLYETIFYANQVGRIGYSSVDVRYDAFVPWITKKHELANLLGLCQNWCTDQILTQSIQALEFAVSNWDKVAISIDIGKNISELLIIHPIKELNGFIFQRQHPIFVDQYSLKVIAM